MSPKKTFLPGHEIPPWDSLPGTHSATFGDVCDLHNWGHDPGIWSTKVRKSNIIPGVNRTVSTRKNNWAGWFFASSPQSHLERRPPQLRNCLHWIGVWAGQWRISLIYNWCRRVHAAVSGTTLGQVFLGWNKTNQPTKQKTKPSKSFFCLQTCIIPNLQVRILRSTI